MGYQSFQLVYKKFVNFCCLHFVYLMRYIKCRQQLPQFYSFCKTAIIIFWPFELPVLWKGLVVAKKDEIESAWWTTLVRKKNVVFWVKIEVVVPHLLTDSNYYHQTLNLFGISWCSSKESLGKLDASETALMWHFLLKQKRGSVINFFKDLKAWCRLENWHLTISPKWNRHWHNELKMAKNMYFTFLVLQ